MFNLCKTKEFQHHYLNTNIISLYPISPLFKHGEIPIFRCHGCKFNLKSKIYEQGKVPLFKFCHRHAYISKP